MATAEQFRAAAHVLGRAADSADSVRFRVRTAGYSTAVVGGGLEALVDRAMIANEVMSAELAAACVRAADESLARAVLCDVYAAQYAQWQANRAHWEDMAFAASVSDGRLPDPGSAPTPPARAAAWIDLP